MRDETGTYDRKDHAAARAPSLDPGPRDETGTYDRKDHAAAPAPSLDPGPRDETGTYDRKDHAAALTALACRQHAVFSLAQLLELGLSDSAVHKRTAFGRLHRIHRAVYSLVPRRLLNREGRFMAAVLAAGPGAVLSHRSAAELHGLIKTDRARIDVTVRGSGTLRRRPGLEIHRSRTLISADTTIVDGIPCTTIARTLLGLAGVVRDRTLERALDQAAVLERLDAVALDDQLERNPTSRGEPRLRAVLTHHRAGATVTDSELEERMLAVCRAANLPDPEVQVWIVPDDEPPAIRVDFAWRDQRLIVETDGRRSHRTDRAFEIDRDRDQRLAVAGWTVIRVTWRQLQNEPGTVALRIARLLCSGAPPKSGPSF